jgi:hypothetical protein
VGVWPPSSGFKAGFPAPVWNRIWIVGGRATVDGSPRRFISARIFHHVHDPHPVSR